MKTLLKLLLISISLYSCGVNDEGPGSNTGSAAVAIIPDSVTTRATSSIDVAKEKETTLRINEALLSSKKEILRLRAEVSDSLTRSDLSPQKRTIYSRTIQQLEASSDIINKQLEDILVSDLQNSKQRLDEIVKKMKNSEKELGAMTDRLDKITAYMQLATTLMATLLPIPSVTTKAPTTQANPVAK